MLCIAQKFPARLLDKTGAELAPKTNSYSLRPGILRIEKPAGGEKQLTWDIYFNYNVSAYYAANAGAVHTGACGAGDGDRFRERRAAGNVKKWL